MGWRSVGDQPEGFTSGSTLAEEVQELVSPLPAEGWGCSKGWRCDGDPVFVTVHCQAVSATPARVQTVLLLGE